jgi:transcriptional regulator with XRE-family HTH domain
MNTKNSEAFQMRKVPSPTEDLIEELKDPEFKKEYGAESAKLEFADVLRDARTQAKLTQQQLAQLLEHSQPYIARLEGGEANPTLEAIGRMLAALDRRIVIETKPIKPETWAIPITTYVGTETPVVMFDNTLRNVFYVSAVKSKPFDVAQDWVTDTEPNVFGVSVASTASPASSVAAAV